MHAVNMERIGINLFSFVKKGNILSKGKSAEHESKEALDGSVLTAQSMDRASFNVLM